MQKRNIQKIIKKILVESKKNEIPYLTRNQIIEEVKKFKPNTDNIDRKVSQALYLLRIKKEKWNEPKIIKYEKEIVKDGEKKLERGWAVEDKKYN